MPPVTRNAPRASTSTSCFRRSPARRRKRADERDGAQRHVDEQHPPPPRAFGEQAPEEHAGGAREPRDGRPDAERLVPVAVAPEGRGQRRQRRRREHRRAEALHEAGGDEHGLGLRQPAGERGAGEHEQAGDQHAAPAEQVGGAPAEQQESAVGEDVAVDHPLEALLGEAEIRPDRGQGDFRIDASRMSMNWTRQSSSRIAMPRRDESDDSSPPRRACSNSRDRSLQLISALPPSSPPPGGHIDRFRFVICLTNYEEAM